MMQFLRSFITAFVVLSTTDVVESSPMDINLDDLNSLYDQSRDDICYDTNYGATDKEGDGCSWYIENSDYCGDYDDDDFRAESMCCSCKSDSDASCNGGFQNDIASCCTRSKPCKEGQGDCDNNYHCESGLLCGTNNCDKSKFPSGNSDCCEKPKADDSGWIKGKSCFGDEYGFIVNNVTRKRNPEITLKDLATAKKDCIEACDKSLSYTGYFDYYNRTCKYASLLFRPETQMCYLAASEDAQCRDKLDFYLYIKP